MSNKTWVRTASGKTIRRRKQKGPPFVQLFSFMLDMPAWLALSAVAKAAYVQLAHRYNGANNGRLGLACRVLAKELRCSKGTAARALVELEDAGFIDTMSIGQFTRKNKLASEYRLTALRCDETNTPPSRRFMQWVPHGLTTGTVRSHQEDTPPPQIIPLRSRQEDRKAENGGSDGLTTGPATAARTIRARSAKACGAPCLRVSAVNSLFSAGSSTMATARPFAILASSNQGCENVNDFSITTLVAFYVAGFSCDAPFFGTRPHVLHILTPYASSPLIVPTSHCVSLDLAAVATPEIRSPARQPNSAKTAYEKYPNPSLL